VAASTRRRICQARGLCEESLSNPERKANKAHAEADTEAHREFSIEARQADYRTEHHAETQAAPYADHHAMPDQERYCEYRASRRAGGHATLCQHATLSPIDLQSKRHHDASANDGCDNVTRLRLATRLLRDLEQSAECYADDRGHPERHTLFHVECSSCSYTEHQTEPDAKQHAVRHAPCHAHHQTTRDAPGQTAQHRKRVDTRV
jgi:hypothetical protein